MQRLRRTIRIHELARMQLNGVTPRFSEQMAGFRNGLRFGLFLRGRGEARETCAGRNVISLADIFFAHAVAGESYRPAIQFDPAFLKLIGICSGCHGYAPTDFAAPRSMGAPTKLPHSVQEPS